MKPPVIPEKEYEIGKQGTRTYEETVETIKDMQEIERWEDEYDLLMNGCEVVHIYETEQFMKLKEFIRNLLKQQEDRIRNECANNHE